MKPGTWHFMIVEKGDPYKKGDRIEINTADSVIGRLCKQDTPEICFSSLYISRKHALIRWDGKGFYVEDLDSKHGTRVNDIDLEPNSQYQLKNGDQIALAKGIVTMTYRMATDFDDRTITLTNIFSGNTDPILVDMDRREVFIEGEPLSFSGKEKELLFMLYRNRNKAVSYDEIKTELWPERIIETDAVPDVGSDEINALVYRLRKRLGKQGNRIVTVARYGVLLEI